MTGDSWLLIDRVLSLCRGWVIAIFFGGGGGGGGLFLIGFKESFIKNFPQCG